MHRDHQQEIRRVETLARRCLLRRDLPKEVGQTLSLLPLLCRSLQWARQLADSERSPGSSSSDEFDEVLSHEIRNRLNLVEVTLRAWTLGRSEEDADTLGPLHAALAWLTRVVEDVSALEGVAEAAGPAGESGQRPFVEVVQEAFEVCSSLAVIRDAELVIASPLPDVPVDAGRLRLVLANLLLNALEHTDPLEERRWVRLSAHCSPEDGTAWVVEVEDNGVGILPEHQRHLFEESDRGGEASIDGRGVGLYVARRAVEQMGGQIWLESEPGRRTTLFFTLPVVDSVLVSGQPPTPPGSERATL